MNSGNLSGWAEYSERIPLERRIELFRDEYFQKYLRWGFFNIVLADEKGQLVETRQRVKERVWEPMWVNGRKRNLSARNYR